MNILYVTLLVVVLDQSTKIFIKGIQIQSLGIDIKGMMLGSSIPFAGDFLRITFVENPGMAFGIGVNSKVLFTILTIFVTAALFYYLITLRSQSLLTRLPLALILGGAIGNMIDRIFYGVLFNSGELFKGSVVDFIDLDFIDISFYGFELNRWWIFNIADMSVSIGIILVLVTNFIPRNNEKNPTPPSQVSDNFSISD
ncbi:MAG: signal peptidase II [Bacteroidetes bacterium]|nr:signal peptidase II [Bacteroidota bacterium]